MPPCRLSTISCSDITSEWRRNHRQAVDGGGAVDPVERQPQHAHEPGLLFAAMGSLVAAYGGLAAHPFRPLGYNVDLWWGLIMLLFGLFMAAGAARARRKV